MTPDVEPFGLRLAAACAARGRLCVGLDPHPGLLRQWGLDGDVTGLETFCRTVVEAVASTVAVLKPQAAFFERLGSGGVAVLERTLAAITAAGALTVLDAKRGDIGSTMAGYAEAVLTPGSPLAADALTVNPYLGLDALAPAVETAREHGRGLYLLARTSNPDSGWLQLAERDGRSVAQLVVDAVGELNPEPGPGSFGVVVGATHGQGSLDLSRFTGSVLVPGVGAQGATIADLGRGFSHPQTLLPTSSRQVLSAGPSVAGMRAVVEDLLGQVATLGSAPSSHP